MKKLLLSIVALCSVATLSAQVKGDKFIGGSLGISTTSLISSGESITGIGFNIAPEFGYFVADKLKVGAEISYGIEDSIHSIQILPNLAYYVRLCEGLYYTPELALGFVTSISDGIAMPGFGVGLSIGSFEFRPVKNFGMSVNLLSFSYMYMSYKDNYTNLRYGVSGVNFSLGVSPSIGLKYYF
jgi:hypothetical protein